MVQRGGGRIFILGAIDSVPITYYTSMPDLPVELWTVVCRLLVRPSLPDVVTYQNDLCAVARVSSVSPIRFS